MISSLCEKELAPFRSLVTVHKYDVRNSESPTGSIEGKKETKRHPSFPRTPTPFRVGASHNIQDYPKKRSDHPQFSPSKKNIHGNFPTD